MTEPAAPGGPGDQLGGNAEAIEGRGRIYRKFSNLVRWICNPAWRLGDVRTKFRMWLSEARRPESPWYKRRSKLYAVISGEKLPSLMVILSILLGLGLAWLSMYLFKRHCGTDINDLICAKTKDYPWTTLTGLAAAPCVLLTWYWRTVHKWRDIQNAAEGVASGRLKDAIDLINGRRMSILGGIHALKALCDASPSYRRPAIAILESYIRMYGRKLAIAEATKDPTVQAEPVEVLSGVTQPPQIPPVPYRPVNPPSPAPTGTSQADTDGPSASDMHLRQAVITLRSLLESEGLLSNTVELLQTDRPWRPGSLSKADLSGSNLSGIDLTGFDLRMATLQRANLSKCIMRDVDLTNAVLKGANLSKAILNRAVLTEASLAEATCVETEFVEVHAEKVVLIRTDLTKAKVTNSWFAGARRVGVKEKGVAWAMAKSQPLEDLVKLPDKDQETGG